METATGRNESAAAEDMAVMKPSIPYSDAKSLARPHFPSNNLQVSKQLKTSIDAIRKKDEQIIY